MRPHLVAACASIALVTACTSSSHPASTKPPLARPPVSSKIPPPETTLSVAIPIIERFVEAERGLKFKHAVRITLLSDKAFVAKLRSTNGPTSSSDEEKLLATLSSLGLIPATTNLAGAFDTATSAGVLGFYDPKTKQLYVRGTKASPGAQAVLSHELTHALTDQWFGLYRPALDKDTQEKSLAFTALIEGDAERTRLAFEAAMPASERAEAEKEEGAGGTPKVPKIVLELLGLPYAVGPSFVDAVVSHGGVAALNAAYRKPPVSSEQILVPATYFGGEMPVAVAAPAADGRRLDASDLGMIGVILMLEGRLDDQTAIGASRGWAGDQYAVWKAGSSRYCMRDTIVMADPDAASRFRTALAEWVAGSNGNARIEKRNGSTTTFLTCSS